MDKDVVKVFAVQGILTAVRQLGAFVEDHFARLQGHVLALEVQVDHG